MKKITLRCMPSGIPREVLLDGKKIPDVRKVSVTYEPSALPRLHLCILLRPEDELEHTYDASEFAEQGGTSIGDPHG